MMAREPNGAAAARPVAVETDPGTDAELSPLESALVKEIRRGHDQLDKRLGEVVAEVRELRHAAPSKVAVYALGALFVLAALGMLILGATRGVDPQRAADAARTVVGAP